MPRLARTDFKGRIWIPERGAAAVRPDALVYDIIDRSGQIVDRVQVPSPWAVGAIGDDGSVYLTAPTQPSVLPGVLGSTFMNNMPVQPLTKLARAVYR
jgi:predicted acyltransferase